MQRKAYTFNAIEEIDNITNWIKDYFIANGPDSKAVIGISGGKDSTVAAALLVRALGADRVIGVLMPQGEQSDIKDSYTVSKLLGIQTYELNVGPACSDLYMQLYDCGLETNSVIRTNTPARIRMTTLYMVAAAVGGRVVNTCNYSEDYVGYSTKYGDLAGDFSVFKNYTVREVLAMGDELDLPRTLVHKVPSDGMCGKSDEDNLGFTYSVLDQYLCEGIYPDYETLKRIQELHKRNTHKNCIKLPAPRPTSRYMMNHNGYEDFEF